MSTDLPLAAEFPAATRDDWRKLVDGVLKGGPFEKLIGKTADGLAIQPIYERAKGSQVIAGRGAATPWRIMQRVDHPDAVEANKLALTDLENGATGLSLVFAGSNAAHGFGLPPTKDALARALDNIFLDAGISLEFEIGPQSRETVEHFAALVSQRGLDPATLDVRFGFDPVGAAAMAGGSSHTANEIAADVGAAAAQKRAAGFRGPFAAADGRVVHNAGGSEAQELAFVLASGVFYLRAFEDAGLPLDDARELVSARLSADADQFLTMAKFRALRVLWARVEMSCGLTPKPLFVAAETAWRMTTRRDPYVNMLRTTMAAFAAGLAGANSISILPHTMALGLPDAFARRIARNTQLLLLEESNLARVTDPAAGSGGIEALTDELGRAAWNLFQAIEAAGGIFAALEHGLLQGKVATVREARAKNIARRKDAITGTSEFPLLTEVQGEVLLPAPAPSAPVVNGATAIAFEPLAPIRLAMPFEALRDRSDAQLKATGQRPRVLLATLGTPADFTARTTFAKSFFEAGGIEAVEATVAPSEPTSLAETLKKTGAALVCLCSSDKVYAADAANAAKALRDAGMQHIYLAGRGGDLESVLRDAGIKEFVFAGCDALAILNAAYKTMGAA